MSEGAGIRDGAGRPRRLVDLIGTFLWSPLDPATWRANLAILLGLLIAMLSVGTLSACFSAGGSLLIWLVGIPIIGLGIEFSRLFARVERWRMGLVDRRPLLAHAYRPFGGPPHRPYGPWVRAWAETEFLDGNRWRDVVYVLVLAPLAFLEFAVAIGLWALAVGLVLAPLVLAGLRSIGIGPLLADVPVAWDTAVIIAMFVGLALVPVAASASRGLMLMHRAVVEGLLCVSPSAALRQEVARLRGSRSAAVELEASELRRIERDLHDGAQQRLVMLSIDLGLAADRMEKDPASARTLVVEAQDQARQALAELRDLVRGIAPAILLDRGLVPALGAIAARCPVPSVVQSTLPEGTRLPDAMERTAYFVVAEALANVAKHASAERCEIRCRAEARGLVVEVWDDGTGGAQVLPTGGLAGLAGRVEALDGSLEVESPPGGPTLVRAVIPPAAYVPR